MLPHWQMTGGELDGKLKMRASMSKRTGGMDWSTPTQTIQHQPKSSISCYRSPIYLHNCSIRATFWKRHFPPGSAQKRISPFVCLKPGETPGCLRMASRQCYTHVSKLDSISIPPNKILRSTPSPHLNTIKIPMSARYHTGITHLCPYAVRSSSTFDCPDSHHHSFLFILYCWL